MIQNGNYLGMPMNKIRQDTTKIIYLVFGIYEYEENGKCVVCKLQRFEKQSLKQLMWFQTFLKYICAAQRHQHNNSTSEILEIVANICDKQRRVVLHHTQWTKIRKKSTWGSRTLFASQTKIRCLIDFSKRSPEGPAALFRNKKFVLNEMFQPNASKFAIFYVEENPHSFFRFSFRATLHFYLMNVLDLVYVDIDQGIHKVKI